MFYNIFVRFGLLARSSRKIREATDAEGKGECDGDSENKICEGFANVSVEEGLPL